MATTELIPTRPNHCTLYELEDNLHALVSAFDLAVEPQVREYILQEIGEALQRSKEKRDAVVGFLRHCESQQKFADTEIERIQKRRAFIARVQEELETYVIRVIDEFSAPDRRGIKRLEGNTTSMRIQKNPDSVMVTDLDQVPAAFKLAAVTMPAYVWEALLQSVGIEDRNTFEKLVHKVEFRPEKKAIAAELKNGTEIPGTDLKFGDFRLVLA